MSWEHYLIVNYWACAVLRQYCLRMASVTALLMVQQELEACGEARHSRLPDLDSDFMSKQLTNIIEHSTPPEGKVP